MKETRIIQSLISYNEECIRKIKDMLLVAESEKKKESLKRNLHSFKRHILYLKRRGNL